MTAPSPVLSRKSLSNSVAVQRAAQAATEERPSFGSDAAWARHGRDAKTLALKSVWPSVIAETKLASVNASGNSKTPFGCALYFDLLNFGADAFSQTPIVVLRPMPSERQCFFWDISKPEHSPVAYISIGYSQIGVGQDALRLKKSGDLALAFV